MCVCAKEYVRVVVCVSARAYVFSIGIVCSDPVSVARARARARARVCVCVCVCRCICVCVFLWCVWVYTSTSVLSFAYVCMLTAFRDTFLVVKLGK